MLRIAMIFLACSVSSVSTAASSLEQEARDLLARYVSLGNAYDSAIVDLYSNDAVISTYRRYPHGLERAMEVTGSQWKELVQKVMPLAKAQNDRSEFKDPQFESGDGRVKITAKRYSVRKCYWDTGYYMILEKQSDGSLKIIEEYSETQPQSDC